MLINALIPEWAPSGYSKGKLQAELCAKEFIESESEHHSNIFETMSALEGKAASGFAKLQTEEEEYLFYNLPADISDPLWVDIKGEYNLSSQELGALKNARCQGKKNP